MKQAMVPVDGLIHTNLTTDHAGEGCAGAIGFEGVVEEAGSARQALRSSDHTVKLGADDKWDGYPVLCQLNPWRNFRIHCTIRAVQLAHRLLMPVAPSR